MKLSPFQLGSLVVGSFVAVVMLNILAKAQSNEDFKTQLTNIKPADLLSIRTKRIAEEHMETANVSADYGSDDENENDDEN